MNLIIFKTDDELNSYNRFSNVTNIIGTHFSIGYNTGLHRDEWCESRAHAQYFFISIILSFSVLCFDTYSTRVCSGFRAMAGRSVLFVTDTVFLAISRTIVVCSSCRRPLDLGRISCMHGTYTSIYICIIYRYKYYLYILYIAAVTVKFTTWVQFSTLF